MKKVRSEIYFTIIVLRIFEINQHLPQYTVNLDTS